MTVYNTLIIIAFIIGYFFITIEHLTKVNKATVALMMAIVCWALLFASGMVSHHENIERLYEHLSSDAQIVLFLLGALTIVEIISAHKGFKLITDRIKIRSKKRFLWMISFLTFFLSSILDNLTTTIVMIALVKKLIECREERYLIGGAIVIAANAGGVWTPIGDVTTTMLWIGGQLSTLPMIKYLFFPSLGSMVVALLILGFSLKGEFLETPLAEQKERIEPLGNAVFLLGIASLIFVPIFKAWTGLPPFMGILFGLSVLWIVTDLAHARFEERNHLRVPHVFAHVDIASTLFFLGILLAVNALEAAGILRSISLWLSSTIANIYVVPILIGLISAIVDNVPLVAASMGMYKLAEFPTDSPFWQMVAYCAGTGGSILIIGSAAGVAFMSLEKVDFFWFFRRITLSAFASYFAGILLYFVLF